MELKCFIDGNALCVVRTDFVNLVISDAVFITLTAEQRAKINKLGK